MGLYTKCTMALIFEHWAQLEEQAKKIQEQILAQEKLKRDVEREIKQMKLVTNYEKATFDNWALLYLLYT